MEKNKFQKWLNKLENSGKSESEIRKILVELAKYSGSETYYALMLSLTEEDMNEVEKIENEKKALEKIEELFRLRTGMTIDELVGKIQMYLIEENDSRN